LEEEEEEVSKVALAQFFSSGFFCELKVYSAKVSYLIRKCKIR
jgi:hypothetical protein